MTKGGILESHNACNRSSLVCGSQSLTNVCEGDGDGLFILTEFNLVKDRSGYFIQLCRVIYRCKSKIGKSLTLLEFAVGMEAVEEGSVGPKVIGNRKVAVVDILGQATHISTDGSELHIVPGGGIARGLLINGRKLYNENGKFFVDKIVRASHIFYKSRKDLVVSGCLVHCVVTTALIPDKSCNGIVCKGCHVAIVNTSTVACCRVDSRGHVFSLGIAEGVGIVFFCDLIGKVRAQGSTAESHFDYAHRNLVVGLFNQILCKIVSDCRECESVALGSLGPLLCVSVVLHHNVCSLFGEAAAGGVGGEVQSDHRIGIDCRCTAALCCRIGVGNVRGYACFNVRLSDDQIYVADKHVFEADRLAVGVYLHLGAVYVCFKARTEGDAPFAVFNNRLGKHTLEFTRDLFAVLAGRSSAPNTDVLISLNHHVVGKNAGY